MGRDAVTSTESDAATAISSGTAPNATCWNELTVTPANCFVLKSLREIVMV